MFSIIGKKFVCMIGGTGIMSVCLHMPNWSDLETGFANKKELPNVFFFLPIT
jgi:hypothetical protein